MYECDNRNDSSVCLHTEQPRQGWTDLHLLSWRWNGPWLSRKRRNNLPDYLRVRFNDLLIIGQFFLSRFKLLKENIGIGDRTGTDDSFLSVPPG